MTILYLYPGKASFVMKDLAIFQRLGRVIEMECNPYPKWKTPWMWLRQLVFLLRYGSQAQIIIVQFGGHHSFLPALIGKLIGTPCLIILGGYDCYAFPSFNYGVFQKKLLGWVVAMSYRLATHLAPVHESMENSPYTYASLTHPNQGFRYFVKNLKTPSTAIHNGYEPAIFKNLHKERDPKTFLTVATGIGGTNYIRKGIDLIIETATLLPDCQFTIIGLTGVGPKYFPENVKLLAPQPYNTLPNIYNTHTFYIQLSMAEGFPNALSEAMLCECVPIGSAVFAIPKLIGDTGYILQQKSPQMLADLIRTAINDLQSENKGSAPSKRIHEHFLLSHRENKLVELINSLAKR